MRRCFLVALVLLLAPTAFASGVSERLPVLPEGVRVVAGDADVVYAFGGRDCAWNGECRAYRIDLAASTFADLGPVASGRSIDAAVWTGADALLFAHPAGCDRPCEEPGEVLRFDPATSLAEPTGATLPAGIEVGRALWADGVAWLLVAQGEGRASLARFGPDGYEHRIDVPLGQGAALAWDGSGIWLAGGEDGAEASADVRRYDPASALLGEPVAQLPLPLAYGAAWWHSDALYVFGAIITDGGGGTPSRLIYRVDLVAGSAVAIPERAPSYAILPGIVDLGDAALVFGFDAWGGHQFVRFEPGPRSVAPLGDPLSQLPAGAAVAWDGDRAWIFGAEASHGGGVIWHRPATGGSGVLPVGFAAEEDDWPVDLTHTVAVWTGDAAYLFSGLGEHESGSIHRFDPDADAIVKVDARLPRHLVGASAVWDGSRAYVFGGQNGTFTDEIVRFDPATGAVDVVAHLPTPRAWTSAVWDGSAAYVLGGTDGRAFDEIVRFDPASGAVSLLETRIEPARYAAAAAWTGERIVILGGISDDRTLDDVLAIDPAADSGATMRARLAAPRHLAAAFWDGALVYAIAGDAGGQGPAVYDPRADSAGAALPRAPRESRPPTPPGEVRPEPVEASGPTWWYEVEADEAPSGPLLPNSQHVFLLEVRGALSGSTRLVVDGVDVARVGLVHGGRAQLSGSQLPVPVVLRDVGTHHVVAEHSSLGPDGPVVRSTTWTLEVALDEALCSGVAPVTGRPRVLVVGREAGSLAQTFDSRLFDREDFESWRTLQVWGGHGFGETQRAMVEANAPLILVASGDGAKVARVLQESECSAFDSWRARHDAPPPHVLRGWSGRVLHTYLLGSDPGGEVDGIPLRVAPPEGVRYTQILGTGPQGAWGADRPGGLARELPGARVLRMPLCAEQSPAGATSLELVLCTTSHYGNSAELFAFLEAELVVAGALPPGASGRGNDGGREETPAPGAVGALALAAIVIALRGRRPA